MQLRGTMAGWLPCPRRRCWSSRLTGFGGSREEAGALMMALHGEPVVGWFLTANRTRASLESYIPWRLRYNRSCGKILSASEHLAAAAHWAYHG